jgi:hypothetical protein
MQKGGMEMENILLVIISPLLLLLLLFFHILYIIYSLIQGKKMYLNININNAINSGSDTESVIMNFFVITFNILYNILIEPYKIY